MNDNSLNLFPSVGTEKLFSKRYLSEILDEIRRVYLADNKPWVIGYSGGKRFDGNPSVSMECP